MQRDDMKTTATQFLTAEQALAELERLSFAFSAIADTFQMGTYQRENAANACKGVRERIYYLHDSLSRLLLDDIGPR